MTGAEVLLIGVDGGATEVKAHAVACDDFANPESFKLREQSAARVCETIESFESLEVEKQFAQRDAGAVERSDAEIEQGGRWVAAAADAIVDVARQCSATRVLIGFGMPGLKTPDKRGIIVINNGPRIPDYLDALESRLGDAGLELAAPIAELGSDADYCGLGEEYAAEGLFRGVENAYYVGCGTGIADALKLRGQLVTFDQAKSWIFKAWQIPSALGPTLERLVSARSINRVFSEWVGAAQSQADSLQALGTGAAVEAQDVGEARSAYPEVAAAAGNPIAIAWLDSAALLLAELIFERMWTIRNGRAEADHRGPAYAALKREHEYRGLLLDRVVIGQRVGMMYADERYRAVFGEKLDAYLANLISASGDEGMGEAHMDVGSAPQPARVGRPRSSDVVGLGAPILRSGFVVGSKLRAAPALGAAVAAARAAAG